MKIKHGLCCHMTSDPSDPDDNSCGRVTCSGLISFPWSCKGERRVENLAIPWLISAFLRAWPLRSAACQVCVKCEFRFFKGYLQKLGNTDILDKRLSRQYKFGKLSVDTVRKRNDLITCNRMRTSKMPF